MNLLKCPLCNTVALFEFPDDEEGMLTIHCTAPVSECGFCIAVRVSKTDRKEHVKTLSLVWNNIPPMYAN